MAKVQQGVDKQVLMAAVKELEKQVGTLRELARMAERQLAVARVGRVPDVELAPMLVEVRQAKARARRATAELSLLREALAGA